MLLWVLLWVALLLGAGVLLGLLGLSLWRKVKALTHEVAEATERLTAVLASLNDRAALDDPASDLADPAIYAPASSAATRRSRRDRRAGPH